MRSIFTSLSPNLEKDDAFLALKLIFRPWLWQEGGAVAELEKIFERDFKTDHAVAFESGRTSLTTLLETANLLPGDEVAVQAYTCVAVPNAVLWAGLKPLYIDCDNQTLVMSVDDLEKKITARTKAVIVQHTFGQPAEMKKILRMARKYELIVIEDCAHVIGGMYQGKLLGTWGDASFFSFGRDKPISSIFGGMVITNNSAWAERLRARRERYPLPSRWWVFQQLYHPIAFFKIKTLYDFAGLGQVIFQIVKKLGLVSKAVHQLERQGERPPFVFHRMPNALALLALHQYDKLEKFNAHRKRIANLYKEYLGGGQLTKEVGEEVFYLRFPLRLRNPRGLMKAARLEKIYLGDWYDTPIAPRGVSYQRISYQLGSCPVAEEVARQMVNLPTDIHITSDDVERIVGVLKEYLEERV